MKQDDQRGCNLAGWAAVVSLILGAGVLAGHAAAADAIVLVDEQHPPCPIVVEPDISRPVRQAVRDLARYLGQIAGQPFAVQTYTGVLPDRAIVIGPIDFQPPDDLGRTGYILTVRDGRLHIAGASERGLIHGIYGLLEDHLGCRWWTHDEELVPSRPDIRLAIHDVQRPAFISHDLYNREAMVAWGKMRTSPNGKDLFTGSHTLCPMLRPYASDRPDFLPMDKNGKRAFNNLHMNYTAPGMADALATELEKLIVERKGNVEDWVYFAGMGDWYGGMDQSPESKAIYETETWVDPDGRTKPGYIAPLIMLMNEVGEKLEQKYPEVQVGTFAYMSLEAPPAHVRPRENVVIRVPRLRHATVRSVLESPKNKSFLRNLERWCAIAPGRVHVWEYGASFKNFLVPFPCLYAMAQNIRLYHELGVAGVMIQGNYTSTGGDLVALKNYVWRKLLWNPTLDPEALVREFCDGYYGPAASHVFEYVQTLEQSVRDDTPSDADEFASPRSYLDDALVAELRRIIERAVAATDPDDGPYRRRVMEVRASLEALELWRKPPADNPFAERDGKLIRTDMDAYTWPRAVDLIQHLRGAGSGEWSGARAYQLTFLTWHGGPIATLTSGEATLKVAPGLAGKVGPLTVGDRVLSPASYVYVNSGKLRVGFMDEGGERREASFVGEAAVSRWGGRAKHDVRVQIEAVDGGAFRFREWARQSQDVASDGRFAQTGARVETTYHVGKDLGQVVVAARQGNRWGAVDLQPLVEADPPAKADSPWPELLIEQATGLRLYHDGIELTDELAPIPADDGVPDDGAFPRWKLAYDRKSGEMKVTLYASVIDVTTNEDRLCLDRTLAVRLVQRPSPVAGRAAVGAVSTVRGAEDQNGASSAPQAGPPRDELPAVEAD